MKGKKALDALCVCIVLLTLLSCASAFVLADPVVPGGILPTAVPSVPKAPHVPDIPHIFPSPTVTPTPTAVPSPTSTPVPTPIITPTPSPEPSIIASPSATPAPTTTGAPVTIPVLPPPLTSGTGATATVTPTAVPSLTPTPTPTPTPGASDEPTVLYSQTPFAFLLLVLVGGVVFCVARVRNKNKK